MRFTTVLFFCAAANLAIPVFAAPRPALSEEMLFSVEQIADLDPENGSAEDSIVYHAAENLVEEFSVSGMVYTDKSLHKDWTITAGEARTLLVSVYESLAGRANGAIHSLLQETAKNDAAAVTSKSIKAFQMATDPISACGILLGTIFVVPSGKVKPKPLASGDMVTWGQAVACLPGAAMEPVSMKAYDRKPAVRSKAMTRGEFIHKLNEAADNSVTNFSNAMY
jgi:hypothetical protein